MVMGGRTMTMGSKTKVKAKRGGRKKCPEGTKCPYKHEYQHDLEFTHEDDLEANEKSKKARTKSPGSSGIFAGGGQRLGESVNLRNSFLSNSNSANTISSANNNSSSSSSSSSNPKKIKNLIPRAVIATAASAREANAPSILSNNGAGGCGRDGSGIFVKQIHSSENKAPSKTVPNLNRGPSAVSSNALNRSSSDPPSRCHNDTDSFNGGSSHSAESDRNYTNNDYPNDEKTRKGMEVINLDSDDEDDEIVFLGQTDSNSNNINSRSNYSSDSNDYYSTSASISSSNSNNSSSSSGNNNLDYNSGRRESYPEIINVNSRGQNSDGTNINSRSNYSSDSIDIYPMGASIPSSHSYSSKSNSNYNNGRRESYPEIISGGQGNNRNSIYDRSNYNGENIEYYSSGASIPSSSGNNLDHYSGRRDSYPEIINTNSKGQENNSFNINNRSNYSSNSIDYYSTDASIPSNRSIYPDYSNGRRDSYPEIINAISKGPANKGEDFTSRSYNGSSSAADDSYGIYFDGYDTRNTFDDNRNGKHHSNGSNLTTNKSPSSSLSSPILADEMLKVICEICSKRVSYGSV
jgi:trimeric autotransporter adhesin